MRSRVFSGRVKNIFAIIAAALLVLEKLLNVEWENFIYDMMVLVRWINQLKQIWVPVFILVILCTCRKNYKLQGTLFSLPFLWYVYKCGLNFYVRFSYLISDSYRPGYIDVKGVWCNGAVALGALLIFAGAVWKFKLWPLITAGGLLAAAGSAVLFWDWFEYFAKAPLRLFTSPLGGEFRVEVIYFFVQALFFIAIAILPLNKKPQHEAEAAPHNDEVKESEDEKSDDAVLQTEI